MTTLSTDELPVSAELLAFYKKQLDDGKREREELLARLDKCEVSHKDMHQIKWELQRRTEEIAELQRALSDSHVYLFDEREQLLRVYAEYDELRIREMEDRRRIQDLLALTRPVAQEVTYFRDCRPDTVTRYPAPETGAGKTAKYAHAGGAQRAAQDAAVAESQAVLGESSAANAPPSKGPGAVAKLKGRPKSAVAALERDRRFYSDHNADFDARAPQVHARHAASKQTPSVKQSLEFQKRGRARGSTLLQPTKASMSKASASPPAAKVPPKEARVLRTVYMPHEKNDTVLLENESLRAQLEEQRRLFEETKAALLEDRRIREEEQRTREAHDRAKIASLEEQLKHEQEMFRKTTRDYLLMRHETQKEQQQLAETNAALASRVSSLDRAVKSVKTRTSSTLADAIEAEKVRCGNFVDHFRQQAVAREDDIAMIRAQQADAERRYENRIATLERKLGRTSENYVNLEHRRRHELDGFKNDVHLLRQQIKQMTVRLMREANPARFCPTTLNAKTVEQVRTNETNVHLTEFQEIQAKLDALETRIASSD